MCLRFYVSVSLCPRFYVANIMPNRPFVAMVLCVQISLWPWFYVAPDVQFDQLCRRSYVTNALCGRSLHAIVFHLKSTSCNRGKLNFPILS